MILGCGKYYNRCKKRLPKDKEDAENSLNDKKENLRIAKEKYEKEEKEYNNWTASQGTGEEDITPPLEESKEEKGDVVEAAAGEAEEEGTQSGGGHKALDVNQLANKIVKKINIQKGGKQTRKRKKSKARKSRKNSRRR